MGTDGDSCMMLVSSSSSDWEAFSGGGGSICVRLSVCMVVCLSTHPAHLSRLIIKQDSQPNDTLTQTSSPQTNLHRVNCCARADEGRLVALTGQRQPHLGLLAPLLVKRGCAFGAFMAVVFGVLFAFWSE